MCSVLIMYSYTFYQVERTAIYPTFPVYLPQVYFFFFFFQLVGIKNQPTLLLQPFPLIPLPPLSLYISLRPVPLNLPLDLSIALSLSHYLYLSFSLLISLSIRPVYLYLSLTLSFLLSISLFLALSHLLYSLSLSFSFSPTRRKWVESNCHRLHFVKKKRGLQVFRKTHNT